MLMPNANASLPPPLSSPEYHFYHLPEKPTFDWSTPGFANAWVPILLNSLFSQLLFNQVRRPALSPLRLPRAETDTAPPSRSCTGSSRSWRPARTWAATSRACASSSACFLLPTCPQVPAADETGPLPPAGVSRAASPTASLPLTCRSSTSVLAGADCRSVPLADALACPLARLQVAAVNLAIYASALYPIFHMIRHVIRREEAGLNDVPAVEHDDRVEEVEKPPSGGLNTPASEDEYKLAA